jgi:molybdopterin converting factor small subunit
MKTNLTLSLDVEIVQKLKKEDNYSDVVNEQIKGFYNVKNIESVEILEQKLIETKKKIRENNKEKREIVKNIEKIKEKERKMKIELKKNFDFKKLSLEDQRIFVRKILKGGED